ncbi:MAG: MFS transporter [Candidatus Omnitrophica bacterium]|nr:MFS transporter [Candidatus Omnitrophota bacterium]
MFKILSENKNFRLLWLGQLISAFGDRLTQMGVLTFIMVMSGDKGTKVALITFFSLLPFLVFGPLFGSLADRYSRKYLMLVADLARAALVIFIPLLWIYSHSAIIIIILVFILGIFSALFTPAKMSIITNITDKDILVKASSMIATTGMVATLIGTLAAGAVIRNLGVVPGFYLNAFTYLISAFCIFKIAYQRPSLHQTEGKNIYSTLISDIKVGMRYIKRHGLIVRLILLNCVFSLISSFAYILILNYGSTTLKCGPLGLGVLLSTAGLGMLGGSFVVFKKNNRIRYKRALYLSYFILGLSTLTFIGKPVFFLTLVILFFAGAMAAVLTIVLDTIFQRITPDELRGKIFAARGMITNSIFLLSLLLVGALIKFVPAEKIFVGLSVIALFVSLRVFLYQRRWAYQIFRLFLKFIMEYLFKLKASGLENLPSGKRVILAGNHTSLLDGAALMCVYPERVYFIAEESLFYRGLLGLCFRKLKYIPIKRGGFNKQSIQKAVEILKSGYSIAIFPEGRIAKDGKLAEGKEGAAVIAQLTGASIVPFAIEGAYEAWPVGKKFPKRFPVEVRFASAIEVKEYPSSKALLDEVMEAIAQTKLFLEREGYLRVEPDEIIKHLIG